VLIGLVTAHIKPPEAAPRPNSLKHNRLSS